ncbi:MAG: helix-turn-helix domain-containing protein [Actinomycetota bacterium]|nr:helix-turn-helix domain-containing protein [Actinomycetota bacterium]
MDRIRELRNLKGVSQAKLAVTAGMDPATLNRIEQGKGNPNLKTLEKLADALGVGVVDLLEPEVGKADAPPSSPEPEQVSEEERRFRVQDWEDTLESLATLYEQAEEELRKADPGVFPNRVIDVAVLASHHLRLLYREEGEVKEAPGVVAAEKRIQHAKASVERMIDQFLNPMSESHVEQTARFKRAAARGATASYTSKEERKGSDDSAQSAS